MKTREIRFQVINNNMIIANEWLSHEGWKHELLNTAGKIHRGLFDDKFWGHKNSLPRRQFTGIKDKKGRGIYEGDILFVKGNKEITKKEYLNQKYVMEWDSVHCCFWAKPLAKKYHSSLFLPYTTLYAEIIGNIYQKKK